MGLVKEPRRFYPYTDLACHLLGFSGLDAKGLEGLERQYDEVLRGKMQTVTRAQDALGRTFWLSRDRQPPAPGPRLILTIDKSLQYQVEKILAGAVKRWSAAGGQAIILSPATARCWPWPRCRCSTPTCTRTTPGGLPQPLRHRPYEPGSTFKLSWPPPPWPRARSPWTSASTAKRAPAGGRAHHPRHPPLRKLNLGEIVKFSSNIGAAKVAIELGPKKLNATCRPSASASPPEWTCPASPGASCVRPAAGSPWSWPTSPSARGGHHSLQLAAAVAAIANGGVLMRPYVVKAVVDNSGTLITETQPQAVRRVLAPPRPACWAADADGHRAGRHRGEHPGAALQVAGKTGTAQS